MDLFFMHWREKSMNKKVLMHCKFFLHLLNMLSAIWNHFHSY